MTEVTLSDPLRAPNSKLVFERVRVPLERYRFPPKEKLKYLSENKYRVWGRSGEES